MEGLDTYLHASEQIPGWTRGLEARTLALRVAAAPPGAVIVEIGTFFGSGAVLLGGARKLSGSGRLHSVDPFDGSGDELSVPHYRAITTAFWGRSQREWFDSHIENAGLSDWVRAHQGTAVDIAAGWTTPVDFLFLDGDQSPAGARAAYLAWSPWLKVGGTIALHNSDPREYAPSHDGHFRLVQEFIHAPLYVEVELVGSITFARKAR